MQKLSRPFELLSDAVATFFEGAVLAQFVLDVPHLNVVYVVVHSAVVSYPCVRSRKSLTH